MRKVFAFARDQRAQTRSQFKISADVPPTRVNVLASGPFAVEIDPLKRRDVTDRCDEA